MRGRRWCLMCCLVGICSAPYALQSGVSSLLTLCRLSVRWTTIPIPSRYGRLSLLRQCQPGLLGHVGWPERLVGLLSELKLELVGLLLRQLVGMLQQLELEMVDWS